MHSADGISTASRRTAACTMHAIAGAALHITSDPISLRCPMPCVLQRLWERYRAAAPDPRVRGALCVRRAMHSGRDASQHRGSPPLAVSYRKLPVCTPTSDRQALNSAPRSSIPDISSGAASHSPLAKCMRGTPHCSGGRRMQGPSHDAP